MLDEDNFAEEIRSLEYCNTRFGVYGSFSTIPIITSVVASGVYGISAFERALVILCAMPAHLRDMIKYIATLNFDDKDFFSIEDYRLLIQISDFCTPRTQAELDADERELRSESVHGTRMFRSHARIILKALRFWRLRFDEKYEEWRDKFASAVEKQRLVKDGLISPSEGMTGRVCPDDGYYSD